MSSYARIHLVILKMVFTKLNLSIPACCKCFEALLSFLRARVCCQKRIYVNSFKTFFWWKDWKAGSDSFVLAENDRTQNLKRKKQGFDFGHFFSSTSKRMLMNEGSQWKKIPSKQRALMKIEAHLSFGDNYFSFS